MTNLAAASLTESSTLKNRIPRAATLIIALSLLSFLTSCAVNPATGSANLVLMSESREKEIGLEGEKKKKLVKCKHFPNCNMSAEDCPFVHPTENCKYFPACTNGEKCIYIHPEIECKFGISCSR